MVRFKDALDAAKRAETPQFCPKCGSHRTEIIGNSDDGREPVVRCNACGTISKTGNGTT
jgi:uncharacterized Zn finger protein